MKKTLFFCIVLTISVSLFAATNSNTKKTVKKVTQKKVEIKNFRVKNSKFDIYLDGQYFKTENFYLENEENGSLTKKIKNIF